MRQVVLRQFDPIGFQCCFTQFETESRRVWQGHKAVNDFWTPAEQLEPQRITFGVSKGFQDKTGGAGSQRMHVNLWVVMRGNRYLVEFGKRGGFTPGGQAPRPGGIKIR